ncbi:MAG: hypothetical protein GX477_00970 [Clostridiaceae bacterium]|nr:hypothetical protein [Clostridiaceae bacterium]
MIFHYTDFNGNLAICDIEIYGNVVIATELDNNTGASITNVAELVAMQVCRAFNINPRHLVWIEHYPPSSISPEHFDRVEFDFDERRVCFTNPRWTRIHNIRAELEKYLQR